MMRILHTNDFHNRLTDEKAATLRRVIEEEKPDLMLDSGDAVKAANMGFSAGGEPILRRMTEMGYNAMCCGNREFHISAKVFPIKVKDAGFPIVCANMRRKNQRSRYYLPNRNVVFEIKGKRVGVFGLLVPMVTEKMAARIVSDYLFDDPIAVGCQVARELRESCDVVIALTHIGFKRDLELGEMCQDIDVILGGHSHTEVWEGERVGRVLVGSTGCYAKGYGSIELRPNGSTYELRELR